MDIRDTTKHSAISVSTAVFQINPGWPVPPHFILMPVLFFFPFFLFFGSMQWINRTCTNSLPYHIMSYRIFRLNGAEQKNEAIKKLATANRPHITDNKWMNTATTNINLHISDSKEPATDWHVQSYDYDKHRERERGLLYSTEYPQMAQFTRYALTCSTYTYMNDDQKSDLHCKWSKNFDERP